jgi:hypothetical protein
MPPASTKGIIARYFDKIKLYTWDDAGSLKVRVWAENGTPGDGMIGEKEIHLQRWTLVWFEIDATGGQIDTHLIMRDDKNQNDVVSNTLSNLIF